MPPMIEGPDHVMWAVSGSLVHGTVEAGEASVVADVTIDGDVDLRPDIRMVMVEWTCGTVELVEVVGYCVSVRWVHSCLLNHVGAVPPHASVIKDLLCLSSVR